MNDAVITRGETPRRGDALVRVGAVIFAVGMVATVATVLPLFLGTSRLPVWAYAASMLMPLGLALALLGLLRAARAQRRAIPR